MSRVLRLTAAAERAVLHALEERVEDLFEDAADEELELDERTDAERDLKVLVRVLEQIDAEHPFVVTPPKVGEAYDFEAELDDYYDDGDDDDEGDTPAKADAPRGGSPSGGATATRIVDAEFVDRT